MRDIRLIDLRVWLACFEAVAKRCVLKPGIRPRYSLGEIHGLVGGVGGEHIRNALRRLERAGLLEWSESAIHFPGSVDLGVNQESEASQAILSMVRNHRRKIPVPRRIIRHIAGGERPTAIATILGHLLRCLYYRDGQCVPAGTCKASWIAEVFGVDERNVKAARRRLIEMGWLIPQATSQHHLNRAGLLVLVNLGWSKGEASRHSKSPPPTRLSTTGLPPPNKDKKLPSGSKNQKPAFRGPAGVCKQTREAGKPTICHVVAADLRDDGRLMELFQQATGKGLVKKTQSDRLRFFSAAEHAIAEADVNPCGLFVTVVRRGLWSYISLAEEDLATRRLKRWDAASRLRTSPVAENPGRAGEEDLRDLEDDPGPAMPDAVPQAVSMGGREEIRAVIRQSLESVSDEFHALTGDGSGGNPTIAWLAGSAKDTIATEDGALPPKRSPLQPAARNPPAYVLCVWRSQSYIPEDSAYNDEQGQAEPIALCSQTTRRGRMRAHSLTPSGRRIQCFHCVQVRPRNGWCLRVRF